MAMKTSPKTGSKTGSKAAAKLSVKDTAQAKETPIPLKGENLISSHADDLDAPIGIKTYLDMMPDLPGSLRMGLGVMCFLESMKALRNTLRMTGSDGLECLESISSDESNDTHEVACFRAAIQQSEQVAEYLAGKSSSITLMDIMSGISTIVEGCQITCESVILVEDNVKESPEPVLECSTTPLLHARDKYLYIGRNLYIVNRALDLFARDYGVPYPLMLDTSISEVSGDNASSNISGIMRTISDDLAGTAYRAAQINNSIVCAMGLHDLHVMDTPVWSIDI